MIKTFEQYDRDPYNEENWSDKPEITSCEPSGAVFRFEYNEKTYYFMVFVNFENEKVIGNTDIESEQCAVFDEDMKLIDYNNIIYDKVEKYIDENIVG